MKGLLTKALSLALVFSMVPSFAVANDAATTSFSETLKGLGSRAMTFFKDLALPHQIAVAAFVAATTVGSLVLAKRKMIKRQAKKQQQNQQQQDQQQQNQNNHHKASANAAKNEKDKAEIKYTAENPKKLTSTELQKAIAGLTALKTDVSNGTVQQVTPEQINNLNALGLEGVSWQLFKGQSNKNDAYLKILNYIGMFNKAKDNSEDKTKKRQWLIASIGILLDSSFSSQSLNKLLEAAKKAEAVPNNLNSPGELSDTQKRKRKAIAFGLAATGVATGLWVASRYGFINLPSMPTSLSKPKTA